MSRGAENPRHRALWFAAGALIVLAGLFAWPVAVDFDSPTLIPETHTPQNPLPERTIPSYSPEYKIPILMYHDVGPVANGLCVTPEMLAEQMDTLKAAGYQTVSLDTVLLAIDGETVRLPEKAIVLTFDDAYTGVYRDAYPILRERGFTATLFVITGLVGKAGYVTWEEIDRLCAAGWTAGCHTSSHPDLRFSKGERLAAEIASARDMLREETGQQVLSFCYPSGKYDEHVIDAVKKAGYYGAVTTAPGVATLFDPALTLPRVRIDGRNGTRTFKSQLSIPTTLPPTQ